MSAYGWYSGATEPLDDRAITTRMRLLEQINPYMAQNGEAVLNMAMSDMDTPTLMSSAAQGYAMQTADTLSQQLQQMNPASQRAIVSQLSRSQQSALAQMGYAAPSRDGDSGLMGDLVGYGASALSVIGQGVGAIPGVKAAGSEVLEKLTWVGNWPGHIYRTVRTQDDSAQMGGLIGAIAGVAAIALAVPTGGASLGVLGSLAALGALGVGATVGAAAGSFATQLTNPSDWTDAFSATWQGERSFDRPSTKRANDLLLDGRMRSLAGDLAKSDIDIVELAREMAGQMRSDTNTQLRKIEEMAATMATPGSAQHQSAVNAMINSLQDSVFQEAVQTLVNGKMSPGRDLADIIPGLDNDSTLYSMISGGVDAMFTVAVDPTLMFGIGNKFYKAQSFTMRVFDGADAATEFLKIASKPRVLRYHDALADAVSKSGKGGMQMLRSLNPSFERGYTDLVAHAQGLVTMGKLESVSKFTTKDMHEYYSTWTNLEPVLRGFGTVSNGAGMQLLSMGKGAEAFRDFRKVARGFVGGLSDVSLEADLVREAKRLDVTVEQLIMDRIPPDMRSVITAEGVIDSPWRINQNAPEAYEAGRALGSIPVVGRVVGKIGDVVSSMTTMGLSGKAVALVGENAVRDVRALSEMGRYMGMPSWARQMWGDTILSAASPAVRANAIHGWLDNLMRLTGADQTDAGKELIEEYLVKSKQIYGMNDALQIDGHTVNAGLYLNEMANFVVMPNIHELFKAGKESFIAQKTLGIADLPIFNGFVNKLWKPAVLLRIGFIPRAAGEEALGFFARGGFGSITQEFGGRFLGQLKALEEAKRLDELGVRLTKDQVGMLVQGAWASLPAHVRPLVRMAARMGMEEPAVAKLQAYSEWLAGHLTDGMGRLEGMERRLANFAGQALDAPSDARSAPGVLGKVGGAISDRTGMTPSRALPTGLDGTAPNQMKINVANYANSILLGNQYSMRRMLFGGVHNDLVIAGDEWAKKHATTIMREISAVQNGPFSAPYETNDMYFTPVWDTKAGRVKQVRMHAIKGERRYVRFSEDGAYKHGVHDQAHRTLFDPLMRPMLVPYVSRIRAGTTVDQTQLGRAADAIFNLGRAKGDTAMVAGGDTAEAARTIVAEFLGGFDRKSWVAMIGRMRRTNQGTALANVLDVYVPASDTLTMTRLTAGLTDARNAPDLSAQDRHAVGQLIDALDGDETLEWLDSLDMASRQFAAQFLHQQVVGKEKSFWATRKAQPEGRPAPGMVRFYRGDYAQGGKNAGSGSMPEWVAAQPEMATRADVQGRWVTEDRELAARYPTNMDDTERGVIRYVDVPEDVAARIRGLADQPEDVRSLSVAASSEAVLPPEYAAQLQDVASTKWLYDSLDEARADIVSGFRAGVLDPNMHDEGVTLAQRGIHRDAEGQYIDTVLRSATVMLYEAPAMQFDSFEDLLRHSTNQGLLQANRKVVERLLGAPSKEASLIANYELAQELQRVRTQAVGIDVSLAPRPRMMYQPREITDGRQHGVLTPDVDTKNNGQTQLWSYPRQAADARLVATPDAAVDPIEEWANQAWRQFTDAVAMGRSYALKPKMTRGEDVTTTSRNVQEIDALFALDARRGENLGIAQQNFDHSVNEIGLPEVRRAVAALRTNSGLTDVDRRVLDEVEAMLQENTFSLADPKDIRAALDIVDPEDSGRGTHLLMVENRESLLRFDDMLEMSRRLYPEISTATPMRDALVYRYNNTTSKREPIQDTEALGAGNSEMLMDRNGRKVNFGDTDYFEPTPTEGMTSPESIMWAFVGPMMRDAYDDIFNATRVERMQASVSLGKHRPPVQAPDRVPVYRSRVEDVLRVDEVDLPTFAAAQIFDHQQASKFEDMVTFGFDRVIGPSIDAIIRKPMAFHAFAQRYTANRKALEWAVDPVLRGKVDGMLLGWNSAEHGIDVDYNHVADIARAVSAYHTDDVRALNWSTNEALAWLRGGSDDDLRNVLVKVISRSEGKTDVAARKVNAYARQLQRMDTKAISSVSSTGAANPREFVTIIESKLPEGGLRSVDALNLNQQRKAIAEDPLLTWIDAQPGGWDTIVSMKKNFDHIDESAGNSATLAAIADVVPFLDSHEFKTQFADHGKGFLPFWYAEENFLKRWGRGLAQEGPAVIRKMQLTYMGLGHAGVIRTDEGGKDWFVYPGSGLLAETMSNLFPGLGDIGVMFQAPTDQMLPGMSTKIGAPSVNPLVSTTMELITSRFPELQPIERSLLGEFASQRSIIEQIVPAHFRHLYSAVFASMDANERMASAQNAAIAHLAANGQAPPDNATPDQIEEFLDRTANHARIIVVTQALGGFFTPGSPSQMEGGDSASLTGLGITDIADVLSSQYLTLVRMLGVEDGTAKFLELNPDGTLDDIVNPLAYTVAKNESVTGAPLPSTSSALEWSIQNEDYLTQFPDAAPWLLPQDYEQGTRNQYAYDQQTMNGLRRRRTPEEYLRAMMFKKAAQVYFPLADEFDILIAQAELDDNPVQVKALTTVKDRELHLFRAAHPVFQEELTSSDGADSRKRILDQMQYVIKDPEAPADDQSRAIGLAMRAFNSYRVQLMELSNRRTTANLAEIETLKQSYESYMDTLTTANPGIMSFWISVLRPEASLK